MAGPELARLESRGALDSGAAGLPERYADTRLMRVLRACERLHLTPAEFEALPAGTQAIYLAYSAIRASEELRMAGLGKA